MWVVALSSALALCPPPSSSRLAVTAGPASTSRRAAAAGLAALALPLSARAASITGTEAIGRRCKTASSPSATTVTCLGFGLRPDGRLSGCAADEGCVSSAAVTNPSKFAPPWAPSDVSPEASDPQRAWRAVVSAVEDEPGLDIVERDDGARYLRAQGASAVPPEGTDDIEFLLRVEGRGATALFRSASRTNVFVYPLQQPVPNQDSHLKRLASSKPRALLEPRRLSRTRPPHRPLCFC